jgi:hypothetical protein
MDEVVVGVVLVGASEAAVEEVADRDVVGDAAVAAAAVSAAVAALLLLLLAIIIVMVGAGAASAAPSDDAPRILRSSLPTNARLLPFFLLGRPSAQQHSPHRSTRTGSGR